MKKTDLTHIFFLGYILFIGGCEYTDPVKKDEKHDVTKAGDIQQPMVKSTEDGFTPAVYHIEGLADPQYQLSKTYGPLFSDVKVVTLRECHTINCKQLRSVSDFQYDKRGRLILQTEEKVDVVKHFGTQS